MALNFPDSPANGDTATLGGKTWTYNTSKTQWSTSSASGGGSSVTVSDTAPATPSDGDQWYNSLDLKLYIRYNDGSSSQWVVASPQSPGPVGDVGPTGGAGAAGASGVATVLADMTALVAVTGMTAGQTALVTGLNKLFMYTGSAWFLIATMTNASPTAITGVNATYPLATDGTATVVTVSSTDPEGFPLTFSHAITTGSLGSTATVVQGTGANTNVFTITPSTNSANAGSFSITFSVTDGATGAVNSIGAFTLAFEMSGALAYTLASPTPTVGSYFANGVAVNNTYTAISFPGIYNAGPGEIKVYNNSNGTLARTISNYDGPSNGNMSHYGSLCCSATYVCAMSNNARFQIFNMSTGAHVRSIQGVAAESVGGGDGQGQKMAMNDTYLLLGGPSADYIGTNQGLAKLYRISDGALMYTWTYAPSGDHSKFGTAVAINETQAAVTYNRGYMSNPYGGVNGVRIFNLGTGNVEHTINAPVANSSITYGHGIGLAMNDNGYIAVGQPDYTARAKCYVYNTATGALRYTLAAATGSSGGGGAQTAMYGRLQLKGTGNLLCCGPVSNWTSAGGVEVYDVTDGSHKYTINPPSPISGFVGTQKPVASGGKFGHFMDVSQSGTVLSIGEHEQYGSGNTTSNVGYAFMYK